MLTPSGSGAAEITVDDKGRIAAVEPTAGGRWDGWLCLPGMVNAHSHCFQRVLCGFVERAEQENSFWGWREQMYRVAAHCTPEDQYHIACVAFAEMLTAGYTSVGEFHYLHHLADGTPGTQMASAVVAAARDTGIRLALLPVLYQRGGFGQPALPQQQRFVHARIDDFIAYVEKLDCVTGIAPHSLRAVAIGELASVVALARQQFGAATRIHLHVAEQRAEVEQCLAESGATPVDLLLENCAVDRHWSVVHATHATDRELQCIAAAGATVVVCPLTEANLGDGIFAAKNFVARGGLLAIGSDCNARIDAIEELRLLEYSQRLADEQRACLSTPQGIGAALWQSCAGHGAASLDLDCGVIETGRWADLVVLRRQSPICLQDPQRAMDAWLTGGSRAQVEKVYVSGEQRRASPASLDDALITRLGLQ